MLNRVNKLIEQIEGISTELRDSELEDILVKARELREEIESITK